MVFGVTSDAESVFVVKLMSLNIDEEDSEEESMKRCLLRFYAVAIIIFVQC